MCGLYVWEIWNTEVSERNHWSHHIVAHPSPLTAWQRCCQQWKIGGSWYAWENVLFFDNYVVNSACQQCGFFPVFSVTVSCVTQTNKIIENYIPLLVQYSCEILKSHVLWHSLCEVMTSYLSMLIFMLLFFKFCWLFFKDLLYNVGFLELSEDLC